VLLVLAHLASLSLAGQEHGRTIPLGHQRLDRHTSVPTINSVRNRRSRAIFMAEARVERRLAAILAADVAGYTPSAGS
jgi:hypothetical protein